ncbi:MAG: ABC transporter permease [Acidimicrobiia bacterium]|nr:ABC transporter permease [Acidimicrobiia bacterium]
MRARRRRSGILCTLARPTSGRAFVAGHDCATQATAVRQQIGLVFQDQTLDEQLTARENLRFHAVLYGVERDALAGRIEEVLGLVGLTDRGDDLVTNFSGGMSRRLEIARALLHTPTVLFLDEPTVGLDPQTRARMWEDVLRLRDEEGVTIFFTTHYMDEAEYADRIAIIDHGRIVALDSPAALKARVGQDSVRLATADDGAAARRAGGRRTRRHRDRGRGRRARGRRRAGGRGTDHRCRRRRAPGHRAPTRSRRRLHALHRPRDPERRRRSHVAGPTVHGGETAMTWASDHSALDVATPSDASAAAGLPLPAPPSPGFTREARTVAMVWRRELIRFSRARARMVTGLIQPILFLLVLGVGLTPLVGETAGFDFKQFIFPGVVAMSVATTAIMSAVSIVWDREFGFLREMLVAPVSRSSLVLGKTIGGASVASVQGAIMLVFAPLVGVRLTPLVVIGVLAASMLMAFALTSFGVFVASRITKMENFQVVMQFLLLPMIFLSGALFPLNDLPGGSRS